MTYGFGITAHEDAPLVGELARLVEELGYDSFWVNGSPPEHALANLRAAADHCSLPIGVGVLPLTRISADQIVAAVTDLRLPQDRLLLGVGSGRTPGAVAEVRAAAHTIRKGLATRIVTGAVGPRMTRLGGEVADDVLFTWWPTGEIPRSRQLAEAGADAANRPVPRIASYIRCALLPQAAESLAAQAARYDANPRYADAFARNRVTAAETVVAGADGAELRPGIESRAAPLDVAIIRAITAGETFEELRAVAEAAAP